MDKEKEAKEFILSLIVCVFLLIGFGFVVGDAYRFNHPKSVDAQHEELMLKGEYKYCPYCGEELER